MTRSSSILRIPLCGIAIIAIHAWMSCTSAIAQHAFPDNPLQGRIVFEQKGCVNCHALKGDGSGSGPDLGYSSFSGSFLDLASTMLNHAPEMLRRMRELDLPFPEFTRKELVSLIAYLYYLRYLGEPGNLYRGKMLVSEKGCVRCHAVRGQGGNTAPPFDRLAKYVSPLYLAQALWNHGPKMDEQLRQKGVKRPTFERDEIADLSAYIRSANPGVGDAQIFMSPGNPEDGRKVFRAKKCVRCHDTGGTQKQAPSLGDMKLDRSVTEIAALMWNHGSAMGEQMEHLNIPWPRFDGKEMADLIAYLYFLHFDDPSGEPTAGKSAFRSKGCAKCHGENARGGGAAPDLAHSRALASSVDLAQFMWNHTPVMEEKTVEKVMRWPVFTGADMRNIFAYLTSLDPKRKK